MTLFLPCVLCFALGIATLVHHQGDGAGYVLVILSLVCAMADKKFNEIEKRLPPS
jgi:hypothetical protein